MPLPLVQSGLVQTVQPSGRTELVQVLAGGSEQSGGDIIDSLLDESATLAIPAIPTTEAPYDGEVAFGSMKVDTDLSGPA